MSTPKPRPATTGPARVIYLPALGLDDAPTLEEAADADAYHARVRQLRAEEQQNRPGRRPPA